MNTVLGKVTITPKGDWSAETAYSRLDVVTYNGSSFLAVQDVPEGTPTTSTAYWQLLAQKGSGGGGGGAVDDVTVDGVSVVVDGVAEIDLTGKQDTISDLASIRAGAALGATALQSVPSTYRTASAQDEIDAEKQDVITDLATIRSGASLGATALQSVPNTYRTSAQQDIIDATKLTDAPSDGKKYGRMDGEWVEVSGGGGETSDFDDLLNRPKYNGTTMSHSTNIPEVKTAAWDAKQDAISDLATIRSGAALGATALQSVPNTYRTASAQDVIDSAKYEKPSGGIPKSDMASAVQTSLGLADSALQSVPNTYRTSAQQDIIDATKIGDAPSDNKQYARKNGSWTEVESSGGGSHTVVPTTILTTDWSSKSATVSVSGVTASNILVVSPAPSSFLAYAEAQVRATAQASGTVTFACETEPSEDLTVNVMIVG